MAWNSRLETAVNLLTGNRAAEEAADRPTFRRLFDVGTDHGWLAIEAVRCGAAGEAWALDLREGPLARAAQNIAAVKMENSVHPVLSDGLDAVTLQEGDAVCILGLGGLEMTDILRRCQWPPNCTLILQPMKSLPELRSYLSQAGHRIVREQLCEQRGRIYPVLLVNPDTEVPHELTREAAWIGQWWLNKSNNNMLSSHNDIDLYRKYIAKLSRIVRLKAKSQDKGEQSREWQNLLAALDRELHHYISK